MPFDATPNIVEVPLVSPMPVPAAKPLYPDPVLRSLIEARRIVARDWARGPYVGHCVLQAIAVAVGGTREYYAIGGNRATMRRIYTWNDAYGRTRDDVVAVLDHAIDQHRHRLLYWLLRTKESRAKASQNAVLTAIIQG